jgi:uncharacterized protein (DUF983 family)
LYSRQTDFRDVHQIQTPDIIAYLLFVVAGIIIAIWAIGFFTWHFGHGIHLLLIIAANLILLSIIQRQKA